MIQATLLILIALLSNEGQASTKSHSPCKAFAARIHNYGLGLKFSSSPSLDNCQHGVLGIWDSTKIPCSLIGLLHFVYIKA